MDAPVVTGNVYAIDYATGKQRWDRPASVKGQGLAMWQPPAMPALLFMSQWEERPANESNRLTRLLCLDKRTGISLARENKLVRFDGPSVDVQMNDGSVPTMVIDLRQTMVTLRFTKSPRPPMPVATAEVEGARKSVSAGLFGLNAKNDGQQHPGRI